MSSVGLEARRAGTDGIQGIHPLLGIERSMGKRRNPFHGRGRAAKGRSCGFFNHMAAVRRSLQSRKPGLCIYSRQHLTASRALASAFDQPTLPETRNLPDVQTVAPPRNFRLMRQRLQSVPDFEREPEPSPKTWYCQSEALERHSLIRADIPRIFLKIGKRAGSNSRGLGSFMTRSPDSVVSAPTGRKAENRKSCHEQNSCNCRNRDRRRAAGDGSGHEHRRCRRRTSDASRKHRRPHRRGCVPAWNRARDRRTPEIPATRPESERSVRETVFRVHAGVRRRRVGRNTDDAGRRSQFALRERRHECDRRRHPPKHQLT